MTGLIIFLSLLVIWYLTGYFRAIQPKNNRWQAWGPFSQIWGYIDGDIKKTFPYSMPWPFKKQFRPLTYTKEVEGGKGGNLEKHSGKSADGKDMTYHEAEIIHGLDKPIRAITEDVNRLRKKEIHSYEFPVDLPLAGFTFYPRLKAVVEVNDPMKTLDLDEFLVFIGTELKDAVGPWAPKQEEEVWSKEEIPDPSNPGQFLGIKDVVVSKMLGLKIDDIQCIIIDQKPLMKFMNDKIEKYGLEIVEFSLNMGYDENVKAILDARAKQQLQDEKTALQEKENKTNLKVLEQQKANRDQERTLDKLYLNEVTIPEMVAAGSMLKTSHEGYPAGTTLFMGDSSDANITNGLLSKISSNTKNKGGTNAAQTTP